MKNLDRKVTLLCPLCGNNQFESLDEEFEDFLHASDDVEYVALIAVRNTRNESCSITMPQ